MKYYYKKKKRCNQPRVEDFLQRVQVGSLKLLFSLNKKLGGQMGRGDAHEKKKWIFQLTQRLPLISNGRNGKNQINIWEKWERDNFK